MKIIFTGMFRHVLCLAALIPILMAPMAGAQSKSPAGSKKLIEFGWDEPYADFLRQHAGAMQRMPFDGTVFRIHYRNPDGSLAEFMNECWSSKALESAGVRQAIANLRSTKFTTFTDNFLRFNVLPGTVGWFDDFSAVAHNAQLAAEVARRGGAAGILFDVEPYGPHIWDYRVQNKRDPHSFDQYARQIRQRGAALMHAFQRGDPDLTVFLTFGYGMPLADLDNKPDRAGLAHVDYGLLPAFLDGMFDAAAGKARIVDGCELSYGYKSQGQFNEAVRSARQTVLPLVSNRMKYLAHLSMGFGLWMDYDWRKLGWNAADPAKNYFSPAQFQASVQHAMSLSDRYVWIYTEKPSWWTSPDARPANLPPAYVEALRAVQSGSER